MMQLQINETGAWRNVITFKEEDRETVMTHGERLAELSAGRAKLQIIETAERNVVSYWTPEAGWQ